MSPQEQQKEMEKVKGLSPEQRNAILRKNGINPDSLKGQAPASKPSLNTRKFNY